QTLTCPFRCKCRWLLVRLSISFYRDRDETDVVLYAYNLGTGEEESELAIQGQPASKTQTISKEE
ncbi:hypothetical protein ACQP3C_28550, partial [Escherichia coli]